MQYLSTRQRIIDIVPHQTTEKFEESMSVENFYERVPVLLLKIQDGCNRFVLTAFLSARGRVRSKPLDDLISEVTLLSEKDIKKLF